VCRSPGNCWRPAIVLTLCLTIVWAAQGSAQPPGQRAAVGRALLDLRAELDGTYGDEGPDIARRIAELSEAGANWDRSIRDAEQRLRPRIAGPIPDDAALAHEELGSLYLERRRFADAITEFEAASRLAPRRVTPHVSRAFALEATGSSDRAAQAFLQAWRLAPDDPITSYLVIARDLEIARAPTDEPDRARVRDTLLRTVQAVIGGAGAQPSSPFSHPVLTLSESGAAPLFPLARYAEGFALAMRGQIDEGAARLREAAGSDPLIVDPASQTGEMRQAANSLRRGNLRDALAALERIVKASPRSSEAHRMLATAAAIAGDSRTSVEHLNAALKIRPDDERSWIALANIHIDAGALVDAARTLEQGIAAIPESGGLRWRLAGVLVKSDRNADALTQYSEAERLTSLTGRAQVYQAVAALALLQLDAPGAAAAVDRRVREDLNDASAHRDLASVYTKQGRQDEAFAELAIAAWLDPDDALTLVALGHSLMAAQRDADAVAVLERAVTLQSDYREARYALAQALRRTSKPDDAQRHLLEFERQRTAARTREQRDLDIAALKSEAVRISTAGQHREAIETWKKVIALEPGVAQNYLEVADTLVKAGALEESLQYFVKTAEMDGVAEVHLRIANVLAHLGRTKESALARDTYERLRLEDFRRRSRR
jgi:tetratricopeptide (TPR) repeat protein